MYRCLALIALLLLVAPGVARAAAPAPRVSLDLSGLDESGPDEEPARRFRELLSARLAQEGFEVVPLESEHDIVLGMSAAGAGWQLRATTRIDRLTREVPGGRIRLAQDRLELVQKAAELARKARALETAAASTSAPPLPPTELATPRATPAPAIATPEPVVARLPPAPEISAGLDLLIRSDHADPVVRLGGRVSLGPHFGLHLTGALSNSGAGKIEVMEGEALVGLGVRLFPRQGIWLDATAAAGALLHQYGGLDASGSGTHIDPMAVAIVASGIRVSRHIAVELRMAPGLSRTEYVHLLGNEVVWSRSRFRFEIGFGLVLC